jgi:hypothetical protein
MSARQTPAVIDERMRDADSHACMRDTDSDASMCKECAILMGHALEGERCSHQR